MWRRVPKGTVDAVLSYCHNTLNDKSLVDLLPYFAEKGVGVISASVTSMGLFTKQVTCPCTTGLMHKCGSTQEAGSSYESLTGINTPATAQQEQEGVGCSVLHAFRLSCMQGALDWHPAPKPVLQAAMERRGEQSGGIQQIGSSVWNLIDIGAAATMPQEQHGATATM